MENYSPEFQKRQQEKKRDRFIKIGVAVGLFASSLVALSRETASEQKNNDTFKQNTELSSQDGAVQDNSHTISM